MDFSRRLREEEGHVNNNKDKEVIMMPNVDTASSLNSTVYDDEEQELEQHRPGSAPPNLQFDAPSYFRFGSSSNDFFSQMRGSYDDDFHAAGGGHRAGSNDSPHSNSPSSGNNNAILSPHVISPSNQVTHEQETMSAPNGSSSSSSVSGSLSRFKSRPSAIPSRRKNSIEMFLSQSPSQALGGDFLKLNLDERVPSSLNLQDGAGASNNNRYSPSDFSLDATIPEATTTSAATTDNFKSSWTSPQHHHQSFYSENVPSQDAYYDTHQQEQQYQSYSGSNEYHASARVQETMFRNAPVGPAGNSFGVMRPTNQHVQQQQQQQQWSTGMSVVTSGYATPSSGYMPAHSPLAQQQNLHYHQQQQLRNANSRGGMHPSALGSGRSIGSRLTPPLPEASPPHSPRSSMMGGGMSGMAMGGVGVLGSQKQCKFFFQGHCRMGSKCKFAHQPSTPSNVSNVGGMYHLPQQQTMPNMAQLQQIQMMPSPEEVLGGTPHHFMGRQTRAQSLGPVGLSASMASSPSPTSMSTSNPILQHHVTGSVIAPHPSAPLPSASSTETQQAGATSLAASGALSVEDIKGRVFAMSKDQNGCRLLQEQLDYDDRPDLCNVIYNESLDHLAEMMVDPFGNYLFQKLLEKVNLKQRLCIIKRVSSNLVAAALNLHGTRSVQKVVEVCATAPTVFESEDSKDGQDGEGVPVNLPDIIVDALKDDAVRLCIDSNGNHVIQRALQYMKPEYNQFVFDAVSKECTTVGTHRHGCCVLQRCLDAANKQQKREVIAQVEKQAMKLMQDPYGNYVVQYVLDSCTAEEAYGVIVKPLDHIFELSIQKFSSNVIEKCLEKAPERVRQKYIKEITNCSKMNKMLQDQFANYVVQRALCVCAEEQCIQLVKAIRPHLATMKNTSGGRRITARILKRFPNMDVNLDGLDAITSVMPPTTGSVTRQNGMNLAMFDTHPQIGSMESYPSQQAADGGATGTSRA